MKQALTKTLKTIFSDVRRAIVGSIVLLLVGGSSGLLYFSRKALSFAIRIANIPTPLWATILFVLLCGVYTRLRVARGRALSTPQNSAIRSDDKIVFFQVLAYNWKTTIHSDTYYEVDATPFCPKHELEFVYNNPNWQCPEVYAGNCDNRLPESKHFHAHEIAESYIGKKVRNHEY
jgi:hypothetical protein